MGARGLGEPPKAGEGHSPIPGVRARERSEERGCNPLRVGVNKIAQAIVITPLAGAVETLHGDSNAQRKSPCSSF